MPDLLPGFVNLKDIASQRVVGDIIPVVDTAIRDTLAVHNENTNRILSLFTTRTTNYKIRYKSPVAAYLQSLDENGRARPLKMMGFYDLAFPVFKAGSAFGKTRTALIKMTVQEANDQLAVMLDADLRWNRRQLLARIFTNVNFTFPDEQYGNLTVLPLANGDAQTYLLQNGNELGATSQHFTATVGALADGTTPFPAIYELLTGHPENGGNGEVISFIPSNLVTAVKGLTSFIEETDPDIVLGANADKLTGALSASVPGRVLGKADRCWIVQWGALPNDYIINVITSGDRPFALREHPEAELQGFQAVADRNDHPYLERQYERHSGLGAWNRVSASVHRVNNASYAIPTNFTYPQE